MNFYRKATTKDFEKAIENTDIPNDIKEAIIKSYNEKTSDYRDQMVKNINNLRVYRGYGLRECQNTVNRFIQILRAKEDYDNGMDVYTDYHNPQ